MILGKDPEPVEKPWLQVRSRLFYICRSAIIIIIIIIILLLFIE